MGNWSCTILLRNFTKTGIHFATRLKLPGRSPSHDTNLRLLCSEFQVWMKRISHANEASKLKMRIARFIRFIRVWCERTLSLPRSTHLSLKVLSTPSLRTAGCHAGNTTVLHVLSQLYTLRHNQLCLPEYLPKRVFKHLCVCIRPLRCCLKCGTWIAPLTLSLCLRMLWCVLQRKSAEDVSSRAMQWPV